jgi:hypothetical protein
MACTCIADLKKRLTGHLEDKVKTSPGFEEVKSGNFDNGIFLLMDSDSKAPVSLPFTLEYTRRAKSSGNVRTYKETTQVLPTHCPFCGKPFNDEDKSEGE